ncbi:hypothetical protein [Neobacillus terrae]|nr:hypothetical protein [Neobacillus terrae]NHM29553.1 hypothetical protein [Neobacillus terrae]
MNESNKEKVQNTNVEFSVEFGDVNGIKLYELPYMNQKNKTKNEKRK